MARTSKAEYEIRLIETESLMLRIVAPAKVKAMLSKKFKVTENTVVSWMGVVRKRWAEDVAAQSARMPELRQERRNQMRAMLYDIVSQANSKSVIIRGKDGAPLLDKAGKPVREARPDIRAALEAMKQLRDLDALDQPKAAHLLVSNNSPKDGDGMSNDEMDFFIATSRFATPDELEAWKKSH